MHSKRNLMLRVFLTTEKLDNASPSIINRLAMTLKADSAETVDHEIDQQCTIQLENEEINFHAIKSSYLEEWIDKRRCNTENSVYLIIHDLSDENSLTQVDKVLGEQNLLHDKKITIYIFGVIVTKDIQDLQNRKQQIDHLVSSIDFSEDYKLRYIDLSAIEAEEARDKMLEIIADARANFKKMPSCFGAFLFQNNRIHPEQGASPSKHRCCTIQ